MNENYWKEFYKKQLTLRESTFAREVLPYLKNGELIDLGCGNYRDTNFFVNNKINADGIDSVYDQTIEEHIKENKSPKYVYARFLWHCIERDLQLKILKWAKKYIFIEARTTGDKGAYKVYPNHERNYVEVEQLLKDLKHFKFKILKKEIGTGLSKYHGEDPHLVRIFASK